MIYCDYMHSLTVESIKLKQNYLMLEADRWCCLISFHMDRNLLYTSESNAYLFMPDIL